MPPAVEKGIKDGMKNLVEVPLVSGTIPHRVEGWSGTSKIILLPASPGTGIIASTQSELSVNQPALRMC